MAFLFIIILQGVAINFVRHDDIRILRDIEQYYSTQIDEMVSLRPLMRSLVPDIMISSPENSWFLLIGC